MKIQASLVALAIAGTSLFTLGCSEESTANAAGQGLTIILKTDQRVEQGEKDEVLVTVNRDDFDGPVDITFSGLPQGVTLVNPGPIARDDATRTYELMAAMTAAPVENYPVTVTARAHGLTVSETFDLTVDAE